MTRAIVMAFHMYTPFGKMFYEPMLDFQLQQLTKYQDEYDRVYFLDSTWDVKWTPERNWGKCTVIKVDPSLRYYDAYKQILPQIKEDLVLFMDNDMVVYRKGIIRKTFDLLDLRSVVSESIKEFNPKNLTISNELNDVVSIIDQIGTYKTDKLNNGNKFCPYWFGTRKDLLLKYLDVEWGPNMPEHETLGKLTEKMLEDGIKPYEWEEDKSEILFPANSGSAKGKDLGYYHIRAGSTPAYLLATKKYGNIETYNDYLKNQPKNELLRQIAWYYTMCDTNVEGMSIKNDINEMLKDMEVNIFSFQNYWDNFRKYHGLL